MRSLHQIKTQVHRRYRRHLRVRKKIAGTPERPRLVVFRSSKHIYAQLVDDTRGVTLIGASDRTEGIQPEAKGKTGKSFRRRRSLPYRQPQRHPFPPRLRRPVPSRPWSSVVVVELEEGGEAGP